MTIQLQLVQPSPFDLTTLVGRASSSAAKFDWFMQLQGQSFRSVKGRETLKVSIAGQEYFIKKHFGIGWKETFKNLFSGKWPIFNATTEVKAIQALTSLGIATTPYVAHGVRGRFPVTQQSFVLTRDLGHIATLEDMAQAWLQQPPSLLFKRAMIRQVAHIARELHSHHLYHRDFYLCHFSYLLAEHTTDTPALYVMDLHRMRVLTRASHTLQMKDLAALYFSAMDTCLTKKDVLVFLKTYASVQHSRDIAMSDMLVQIARRASRLHQKYHRKKQAGISL